jgi:hypothetical protein
LKKKRLGEGAADSPEFQAAKAGLIGSRRQQVLPIIKMCFFISYIFIILHCHSVLK